MNRTRPKQAQNSYKKLLLWLPDGTTTEQAINLWSLGIRGGKKNVRRGALHAVIHERNSKAHPLKVTVHVREDRVKSVEDEVNRLGGRLEEPFDPQPAFRRVGSTRRRPLW